MGPFRARWFTYRRISFFNRQSGIVTLLPRLGPLEPDLRGPEELAQTLHAEALHDAALPEVGAELRQRPAAKGLAQELGRTQRGLDDKAALFLRKRAWPSPAILRSEGGEAAGVKALEDGTDVLGREVEAAGNVGYPSPLGRGQDHLGPADLDGVGAAADEALEPLTRRPLQLADIEAHREPPAVRFVATLSGYGYPLPSWIMMQPTKVLQRFWKRH